VENDRRKNWEVVSTEFDFIEPVKEEYVKHKVVIRPEDISVVRTQIKETYQNIQEHKFEGCGKEDCSWCGFVRSNFTKEVDVVDGVEEEEK
jgi:DNA helicase-2/ATP-dependent DNA helicase PcrA